MSNSSRGYTYRQCIALCLGSFVGVSLIYSLGELFKDAYFSDINDCSTLDNLGCVGKQLNNTQAVSCTESISDDDLKVDSRRYCSDAQIVKYNNLADDLGLRNQSHGISIVMSSFILMGLIYCLIRANRSNSSSVYDSRYRNVGDIAVPASLYGSSVPVNGHAQRAPVPSAPPVATVVHNHQQSQAGYAPTMAQLPV